VDLLCGWGRQGWFKEGAGRAFHPLPATDSGSKATPDTSASNRNELKVHAESIPLTRYIVVGNKHQAPETINARPRSYSLLSAIPLNWPPVPLTAF